MTDSKTATARLRELLDERGVEWWNYTDPEPQHETVAYFDDRIIIYHENVNGTVGYHAYNTHDLTPEQAIAATLGAGECEDVNACGTYVCYECNANVKLYDPSNEHEFNYCPNCGARVVL